MTAASNSRGSREGEMGLHHVLLPPGTLLTLCQQTLLSLGW